LVWACPVELRSSVFSRYFVHQEVARLAVESFVKARHWLFHRAALVLRACPWIDSPPLVAVANRFAFSPLPSADLAAAFVDFAVLPASFVLLVSLRRIFLQISFLFVVAGPFVF